jgi:hypothetical protein
MIDADTDADEQRGGEEVSSKMVGAGRGNCRKLSAVG